VQQRALARARAAAQGDELAAGDLEADVLHGGHAAVALRDVLEHHLGAGLARDHRVGDGLLGHAGRHQEVGAAAQGAAASALRVPSE
jgi:hypothetical protein